MLPELRGGEFSLAKEKYDTGCTNGSVLDLPAVESSHERAFPQLTSVALPKKVTHERLSIRAPDNRATRNVSWVWAPRVGRSPCVTYLRYTTLVVGCPPHIMTARQLIQCVPPILF